MDIKPMLSKAFNALLVILAGCAFIAFLLICDMYGRGVLG